MKPKNKTIRLNARVEELLNFAPPKELRKSIQHIFFNYLNEQNKIFPKNFNEVVTDIYLLLSFLEDAEEILHDELKAPAKPALLNLNKKQAVSHLEKAV